jgi:hypothetical protein
MQHGALTRLALCGHYLANVSKRTNPQKPVRSWRVNIIRSKDEYLGSVEEAHRSLNLSRTNGAAPNPRSG